jgi:hypothetical protein
MWLIPVAKPSCAFFISAIVGGLTGEYLPVTASGSRQVEERTRQVNTLAKIGHSVGVV